MRTPSRRVRLLAVLLLLAAQAVRVVARRRHAAPTPDGQAPTDDLPAGEVPRDVIATDAGLTGTEPAEPTPAEDVAEDVLATDAGLTATAGPDDLRAIRGIGPSMERTLHGLGITSYQELADLGGAELDRVRNALADRSRPDREDWMGQARELHQRKYRAGLGGGHGAGLDSGSAE